MELQDLIYQLPFDDLMDIEEFLHIDDYLKGNEELTDDDIISMVKSNNSELEIDPNEGPLEVISTKGALDVIDSNELNMLQKLRHQSSDIQSSDFVHDITNRFWVTDIMKIIQNLALCKSKQICRYAKLNWGRTLNKNKHDLKEQ
ncbi:hypothetical protein RhiirC2_720338 [Rhizophagus irregularis]|uniref:Uncharacterized protein n=1 Tax=Rhizophagus irregularis TaxID=588596 RepID=A0A2N1MAR3_9GLOM|nr:hypothetical protein RhiirC2_720338 [Rhizophagus irregularis]